MVVYHDKKFTTVALTAVFVVNTVLFLARLKMGTSSLMVVLTQIVINILFVLTYAYTNRLQRIFATEDEKEIQIGQQEQEHQMMQLLETSEAVKETVSTSKESAVRLRNQMQAISNGNTGDCIQYAADRREHSGADTVDHGDSAVDPGNQGCF